MALIPIDYSDEQLLAMLRSADERERGFRQFMALYQQGVYRHVRRMLAHHEDTNDVVQNTFVKAYRGLGNFEGRSSLATWLYRIATNEALTFLEGRKRRQTDNLDDGLHQLPVGADSVSDSDDILRRLEAAIQALPDKQKAVFNLRYYDEMPYDEMSEVFGTSVGALKASYHHAAKKVEAFLRSTIIS